MVSVERPGMLAVSCHSLPAIRNFREWWGRPRPIKLTTSTRVSIPVGRAACRQNHSLARRAAFRLLLPDSNGDLASCVATFRVALGFGLLQDWDV